MATLDVGKKAPDFSWKGLDGKPYALKEALAGGPMLVAFFKTGCPTCQYAFPFLERFGKHFGRVWGVSQDDARDTKDFAKTYGVSFPMLLEDTEDYPTSNAYGLNYVPSVFLVGQDGQILYQMVGFAKKDMEDLAGKLAALTGKQGFTPFKSGEDVAAFKAG
jgi:peroxiredoxin